MNVEGTRYFGRLGNAERRELMTKAWVHVNPSVREGFGLNVVEANAFGIPSVAYDVPGLRDSIKDGETGLLVETGNIESLGRSLTRLLEDHVLRIKLGENALEYAGRFSWDKAADEFLRTLAMI
jgi:glycosyltransferase involved in cell wall biosynthesis